MALSIALPRPRVLEPSAVRMPRLSEQQVIFGLAFVLYIAVAAVLVFKGNALAGDGVSRVATANRILFSRDPHLAAIGFVWSPLPNLVLLPLVLFKFLWPPLVSKAFAGNIASAFFMAAATWQLLGFFKEAGVGPKTRLVLTGCFALHPLIVLFGANSMSEAQFIFFLVFVVRYLARWLRTNNSASLVLTGLGLGLAYLTRYEAVAAAMAVLVVVAVVAFTRNAGGRSNRLTLAACDSLIVGTPFVFAFALWALASWLVTRMPFQQFTSVYGNSAQVQAEGVGHPGRAQEMLWAGQGFIWLQALEPLVVAVAFIFLIRMAARRDVGMLAIASVLASVSAFMYFAYLTGMIPRQLRYFIVVIPLAVVMVAAVIAPSRRDTLPLDRPRQVKRYRRSARIRAFRGGVVGAICVSSLVLGIPAGAVAVLSPVTNPTDAYQLQAVINRGPLTQDQRLASTRWMTDRAVAAYIDSIHPGRGRVLIDDFLGFVVVMSSSQPDQFVITPDRDFESILADPEHAGIQYLVVPPNRELGTLDALNRAYPHLYDNGGGIASLVRQFNDSSDLGVNWRIYAVNPPTS